ncbi:MAG: histidine kinase [Terracidiphilus sp.]|jgi:sensor histidine kinase YesM
MTIPSNPPAPNLSAAPEAMPHSFGSSIVRTIWTVFGATLMIFLIFSSTGQIRLSRVGSQIIGIFVYSTLIVIPSVLLLNWIGHHLSEKYPRTIVFIYALALMCAATAGTFIGDLVLLLAGMVPHNAYWAEFRWTFPFSIVISLMFGLSITTYETLRYKLQATVLELRTRQVEQERAYKLLAEAQLSSLESRIHPHFLFNTLNSIAALIPTDPQRAEDTVGKLASLLRFSLNANQTGLVPLRIELKIVRDYLEIEKTRFGSRIRYEIAVPETLDDFKVPPLALQSLVENAVKHVVSQRAQGAAIQITGRKDAGRTCLEVIDDGPGFSLDAIAPEHGLGNLMARIDLLYGDAGQLEVTRENEKTVVRLSFPA